MRKIHFISMNPAITIIVCVLFLTGITFLASADDLSPSIREKILQRFPDAVITQTRPDTWKGQPVTEVEITTSDGIEYEVTVSDGGEILDIEEEKGLPWIGGELMVGLALSAERGMYKGDEWEYEPNPFFLYHNGPLQIICYDFIGIVVDVYKSDRFSVGLKGTLTPDQGYSPDDSDFLKGMDELETLYDAGLEFGTRLAGIETGLEIMQDVSGEHDGQQATLSFGYSWMAAGFEFNPELSLTWMSEKTVDYFYGVSDREARADRPAYSPGASYEIGAELLVQRPLFGNFSLVGLFEITTFGKEITDSPLVEKDYEIEGAIGVAYAF